MAIQVALTHRTTYTYDRPIALSPHVIRLRPAPHARMPILSYSLNVEPEEKFLNWQQDAFANWQARVVFPEKADKLDVTVDLVTDMVAINPFDFFLEDDAQEVPFVYDKVLRRELAPYLRKPRLTPRFREFVEGAPVQTGTTNDWLVALNQYVQQNIAYTVRMEPGVQTPSRTISLALGSCRDSGWLLVEMFRQFGYAARFVSGYLIQLAPDVKSVEGPSGPEADFTDLHAWCEVYLPGAGWVGLDPTSGLFAGEGHIPLACTPQPSSAAPITGAHERAEVTFGFEMNVTRIAEPPRITRPLTPAQWAEIDRAGEAIESKLQAQDVRLTMGGEPTFIAANDRDADEWNTAAVGPTKRHYADKLIRRLRDRFAPGGVLHYGQGKWYPGEPLPRWAFSLIWSGDGMPLWQNANLIAAEGAGTTPLTTIGGFSTSLAEALGLEPDFAQPVYEDPAAFALQEGQLPENVTPEDSKLDDPEERARLLRISEQGLGNPVAYVIPIQLAQARAHGQRRFKWASEKWGTRRGKLYLMPGDSPAGFRLPLGSLQWLQEEPPQFQRDPSTRRRRLQTRSQVPWVWGAGGAMPPANQGFTDVDSSDDWVDGQTAFWVEGQPIRTALTVEVRDGTLCVFLPPTGSVEHYLDLLEAVEDVATAQDLKVHVEGYEPPHDHRVNTIKVTPDPGVIEINIHPAANWAELREITATLYEEARQCGLDSYTFLVDGRLTGSGGGNHIVVGGATPGDSPFLRRPDVLGSIVRYWQRHPSLSYLFSGLFIGPTSQAPRFDEGRPEAVYEMEIALKEMERLVANGQAQPWLTDRLFRHLLTDMTGNTHRAEICIDKMFSPDGPTGRLGLVEFRGFEMPPHWQMSLAQALVLRALIAWFWAKPYQADMVPWGTALHDRFLLEDFVWADFGEVLDDLSRAHGMPFRPEWFDAQREFRFAQVGEMEVAGVQMGLRNGIEPWLVLGEESTGGGTARYVDSSVERLQMRTQGLDPERHAITCNGYALPLKDRGNGVHVAGVRFRSWQPWSALHPTVPAHGPLVFDLFDRHAGRSAGGCTYRVAHQGGRAHETRPVNHLEAEGRALARFEAGGHSAHLTQPQHVGVHPAYPVTLDMRRL